MKLYSKEQAVGLISSMIKGDRLCHSFVLAGEKGVGKRTLANYIAMQILCEKGTGTPCGVCKSCLMAESGGHPDIIYITPSGKSENFRVDDLRPVVADASVAANEGGYKVYILPGIDKALPAAQNILLKVFEEPPDHVIFIMTAEERERVLQTILSRAIVINVTPADKGSCIQALTDNGATNEKANEAYEIFGGNIGRCIEYLQGDIKGELNKVSDIAKALSKGDEYGLLRILSTADKESALEICRGLLLTVCDACVIKQGGVPSSCFKKEAEVLSQNIRLKGLMAIYERIGQGIQKLSGNGNLALTLSSLSADLFAAIR